MAVLRILNLSSIPRMGKFKKLFVYLIALCFGLFCCFAIYTHSNVVPNFFGLHTPPRLPPPAPLRFNCSRSNSSYDHLHFSQKADAKLGERKTFTTENKVLILVETQYSLHGRQLIELLDALKFPYRVEVFGKNLPLLTTATRGRFSLVLIENYYKYLNMDDWNRQLLDKYCKDYGVGIISFMMSRENRSYSLAKVLGFPLKIYQNQRIDSLTIAPQSSILHSAKSRQSLLESEHFHFKGENEHLQPKHSSQGDWLLFLSNHESFEPLLVATLPKNSGNELNLRSNEIPAAILDNGKFDGIKRILFGYDFRVWLVKFLMLDSIRYLTERRMEIPLVRYLQIDIDDIFVGKTGYRMLKSDVDALIEAQEWMRAQVPGFTFNLGYSGKFFQSGSYGEKAGDAHLVDRKEAFQGYWFPHMWKHNQAHRTNDTHLEEVMRLNAEFAKKHGLRSRYSYAVAPHHAGVYPVHEPLYASWKRVWGIKVTSTEEYPHLKPMGLRRGFIHRGIMVLPRQTCGLFTHTVMLDRYPDGGAKRLHHNILGGELFFTFLLNPFLIFMTHQSNYANDRLALYTFKAAIEFVQCWTNLNLQGISPLEMGKRYFERYPEEKEPIWGNPCLDKRHLDIWASNKSCDALPQAIVIGPQKTGTTALHTFMKLHPSLVSSKENNKTFEEVQFFSGRSYRNGIDWYMKFFEIPLDFAMDEELHTPFFFEKSATYFDSELAPKRIKALVPDVKLMAILLNPSRRAYSWYQHMKAHGDPIALKHNFGEVLRASDETKRGPLWKLRQHCLNPGMFAHHIERWLEHFSSKQILLVDGEELKEEPAKVMDSVQIFLGISPVLDYPSILKYDSKKGFYCQLVNLKNQSKTKCLGRGKGRTYDPLEEEDRKLLSQMYLPHNVALHRLLKRLGYVTPNWLQEELEQEESLNS